MSRNYKLILLTGFPRSGTTWLGEEIAKRYELDYIFEPFSVRYHPRLEHSLHLRNLISNFFEDDYHQLGWFYEKDFRPEDQVLMRIHVDELRTYYQFQKPVLLIKQPLSVKLNWALQALQPDVVFWVDRHPGGILASYQSRNLLKNWTYKEYKIFKQEGLYNESEIGRQFFRHCKKSVQRFFTLFHAGRTKALGALENYGHFHYISYEEACHDLDKALEPLNAWVSPRNEIKQIDKSYKKDKGHLNTAQNSTAKRTGWHSKLKRKVLRGMANYFDDFKMDHYQSLMPVKASKRTWKKKWSSLWRKN
jgi:hypothetical protein